MRTRSTYSYYITDFKIVTNVYEVLYIKTGSLSAYQWSGRPVFNPRLGHTKDFKNDTWYLLA